MHTTNTHITLGAGGATLSGTVTVTAQAWEGPVVFSGKGTVTGKRVTIRPM